MSQFVNALPGVPDVESPLFEPLFREKNISQETRDLAVALRRDGYVVLDFPDSDFHQSADSIIQQLNGRYDWEGWRNRTVDSLRVQDAWQDVPEVRRIACNPTMLQLLTDLYGKRAFPFQTLNFPVGTQQHYHTDSIHFSSCPERFMAGVWVALEDIDSDNGPLIYYPGSHSLPIFTNEQLGVSPDFDGGKPSSHYNSFGAAWEQIVEALNLKPLEFHAKKGQALIWAANLLHGGAAQKDLARTRYSQVTHYFFEGCTYYTPLHSVPLLGPVLYRDIVDISTGQKMPNMISGKPVEQRQRNHANVMMSKEPTLPADFDPAAYLKANPDVKKAKADPAQHYLSYGFKEGRPLR